MSPNIILLSKRKKKSYFQLMRALLNIVLSSCLLISTLLGVPSSVCPKKAQSKSAQKSCCNTTEQQSCCCFKEAKSCSCMQSSDEDQISDKPVQYIPSKKQVQITFHAFYLNEKPFVNSSFNILQDHIWLRLTTEVQKILPLLN